MKRSGRGDKMADVNVRLSIFLYCVCRVAAASQDPVDRLPGEHRAWLERDVAYIITDRERGVFLSLETADERERFIEAFWRKRDTNRATARNEFREEHYRRLAHANEHLGRETFREGWRTDRGRYYILLGEPVEIQRYEGYNQLVSAELWFYQGDVRAGLPGHFYLLFFRKNDVGEYTLYHPVADGPRALLRSGPFLPGTNDLAALDELKRIAPELATASLSFDVNEPPDFVTGRPSPGTELLLASIEDLPKRAIRTDDLDAWSRYGNRVAAEYSFNYVPSRSTFAVFPGAEETPMVHFAVELDAESFALATDDDRKFETTLDATVEARDAAGTLVYDREEQVPIRLDRDQLKSVEASPFSYQGMFPLVPGRFDVTVILRNRVLQQYTVAERELVIDPPAGRLSDVLLAYDRERVGAADGKLEAFRIGTWRIEPAVDHTFAARETAYVVAHAGAPLDGEVHIDLLDESRQVVRSMEGFLDDDGVLLQPLDVRDLTGGRYEIRVRLSSSEGSAPLSISPRTSVVRPGFSYRQGFDARVPGVLALVRGEQLQRLGRHDEARAELERAVARGGRRLPVAWWKLAYAHLHDGNPDRALDLLGPMEAAFPEHFEVIAGLGLAHHQKKDFAAARRYLSRARALRPLDAEHWKALGEAELALGNPEAARDAFERSLALDPEQPDLRERLASLVP